jgi:hypothetical protein
LVTSEGKPAINLHPGLMDEQTTGACREATAHRCIVAMLGRAQVDPHGCRCRHVRHKSAWVVSERRRLAPFDIQ